MHPHIWASIWINYFGSLIIKRGLYTSWQTPNSVKIVGNSNSVGGSKSHSLTYSFSLELCKIQTTVYQTHSSGFKRAQPNSVKAGIHFKWIHSGWKLSLWINHFLLMSIFLSSECELPYFLTPHFPQRQTPEKECVYRTPSWPRANMHHAFGIKISHGFLTFTKGIPIIGPVQNWNRRKSWHSDHLFHLFFPWHITQRSPDSFLLLNIFSQNLFPIKKPPLVT